MNPLPAPCPAHRDRQGLPQPWAASSAPACPHPAGLPPSLSYTGTARIWPCFGNGGLYAPTHKACPGPKTPVPPSVPLPKGDAVSLEGYSCCHQPQNPAASLLINSNEPLASPGRRQQPGLMKYRSPERLLHTEQRELQGACQALDLPLALQGREEMREQHGFVQDRAEVWEEGGQHAACGQGTLGSGCSWIPWVPAALPGWAGRTGSRALLLHRAEGQSRWQLLQKDLTVNHPAKASSPRWVP